MVDRGLYFQAFDRLYNAHQEFLQALFISRRTYPIVYNKWIHEQIVDILHLPELYESIKFISWKFATLQVMNSPTKANNWRIFLKNMFCCKDNKFFIA